MTWFCLHRKLLWKVKVPVLAHGGWRPGAPCATLTPSTWPIAVPTGSGWTTDSAWLTNKAYPEEVADALRARPGGYPFRSKSPMEDFLAKIARVTYQVFDFATGEPVAGFTFDPPEIVHRDLEWELSGTRPVSRLLDPTLGLDIDADASLGLPVTAFAGIATALPAGAYLVQTWWTMSQRHCDGLGLHPDNNCLPAGDSLIMGTLFDVVP